MKLRAGCRWQSENRRPKWMDGTAKIGVIQLAVLITWTTAAKEQFVGHQLLKITPHSRNQVAVLNQLHEQPPVHIKHLDFWSEPSSSGETVFLRVNPTQSSLVKDILEDASIPYEIIVDDVQSLLDDPRQKIYAHRRTSYASIYDSYLTYEQMLSWLEDTVAMCSTDRCSLIDIGQSYESRRLVVIKISGSDNDDASRQKKAVWIDAGIHAREWISHATALYFIDRLVVDYTFDNQVRSILDEYDFYILPCVNPDGYQYSHETNRLWRKTRSVADGSNCLGADANRNFNFFWGTSGTSTDPCSDIYRGPVAFSEPEARAVANFIIGRNSTWEVYLTLHSYSQLWMAPYGYTRKKPTNYDTLMSVANAATEAIQRVYGTTYTAGSASEVLYRSSGTSRDWAAGVARIPYVYTVELRDGGSYGFLLPPDQILETGAETWEGLKAMMAAIQILGSSPST